MSSKHALQCDDRLQNSIKKYQQKTKDSSNKHALCSKLVKKHCLQSFMRKSFGISRQSLVVEEKMSKRRALTEIKKDMVRDFFEQDRVSRATSGKKETVTRQKKKMQKM